MWRVVHAELVIARFEMKPIATNSEPLSPNSPWPARQSARIHRLHQSLSSLLAKFRLASNSRGDSIRLRCRVNSVPTHLRECCDSVDTIKARAIAGSFNFHLFCFCEQSFS